MFLLIFCCWVWRHPSLIDLTQKPKDNSIKKQLNFYARASEDVVVSSWGQQISAWLGSSNFITQQLYQKQIQQEDTIKSFWKSYWHWYSLSHDFHERFSKLALTSFSLLRLTNQYPSIMAAKNMTLKEFGKPTVIIDCGQVRQAASRRQLVLMPANVT